MNLSVVLAVVLGLALVGAVVALVLTERRHRSAPTPAPSAAVLGREALDVVDVGLRSLAAECGGAGRALPDVYAVAYSEDRLRVLLSGADAAAPPPWTPDEEGESWSVAPDRLEQIHTGAGARAGGASALPYALVVTVGVAGSERVLVDLSRASGTIAVTGDDADVRKLVRAVVTEVLTGPVGHLAEVTLVGSVATRGLTGDDVPRSARLHTVATLDEALNKAPDAAGGPAPATSDVTQIFRLIEGRPQITDVADVVPRLFVLDADRLPEEQEAVARLASTDALLVLGDTPAGWRLRAGADGSLDTGPLGLEIDTHAGRMA